MIESNKSDSKYIRHVQPRKNTLKKKRRKKDPQSLQPTKAQLVNMYKKTPYDPHTYLNTPS
jgi:hypothetical protein